MKNLLVLAFLFTIFISPLSPLLTTFRSNPPYFSDYYPPSITSHEELLQTMVGIVPKDASVLTQNNIFPHFSSRINAYVYPIPLVLERVPLNEIDPYLTSLIDKSEYILVDTVSDPQTSSLIIDKIVTAGNYGIYAYADGIYLFKQSFRGDLSLPLP